MKVSLKEDRRITEDNSYSLQGGMTERSKLPRYLLKDWTGKLGLVFGAVGIIISLYSILSQAHRVPNLVVDPARITIVNSKLFPNSSLKVTKGDNAVVKDDVTALRVFFWNSGNQSIKSENVIQPLTISLNDANAEILDYKILKVSRPDVVKISVAPSEKSPIRELLFSFNILEKDDGFFCQIIYSGNPSVEVKTFGAIEGVKQINSNKTVSGGGFWSNLLRLLPICLIAIAGVAVFIYWRRIRFLSRGKTEGEKPFAEAEAVQKEVVTTVKPWKYHTVRTLLLLLSIGFILYVVFAFYIYLPKESDQSSVLETVPSSIKP